MTKKLLFDRLFDFSVAILFLLIWQGLSFAKLINENLLPPPITIIKAMYEGFASSHGLIIDSFQSVKRVLFGYCLGSIIGLCLGFLCSLNKNIERFIVVPIEIIRPIPPIAWIPISILWFGSGELSAYFLIALGAFYPVFTNSILGVYAVQQGTVDVAECHGASGGFIFRKIILPQALPSIFSGLQTGLGIAWMIVITAELVGVQSGLGYFIQVSRAQLQIENVVGGMFIIGIIGFLLNILLKRISQKCMPWQFRLKNL